MFSFWVFLPARPTALGFTQNGLAPCSGISHLLNLDAAVETFTLGSCDRHCNSPAQGILFGPVQAVLHPALEACPGGARPPERPVRISDNLELWERCCCCEARPGSGNAPMRGA